MKAQESRSKGSILLVEDDDLLRWAVVSFFRNKGFAIDSVEDGEEGVQLAGSHPYDLLITDLHLADLNGLGLAAAVREKIPGIQVVVITGEGSKESILAALRQGVWDYVEKPFDMELLLITVEKALEKSRMEQELVRLSRTDGLTGLYNQRYFYTVLEKEMKRASRQERLLSLILLDVDNFKQYNDSHGHLAGDDLLARIAGCVKKACRKDVDLAFRYGGDEFVIVLPEADEHTARNVASRICQLLGEAAINLTLSIGVTELNGERNLKEAVREADEAMYLAKQFGGNRLITFNPSS